MSEYEQTQVIDAPADEVFAWLADMNNLPGYLPPVTDASVEEPSAEGTPGQRVLLRLEFPNGASFDSEGYLAVDEARGGWSGARSPSGLLGLAHRRRDRQPERDHGTPRLWRTLRRRRDPGGVRRGQEPARRGHRGDA